MSSFLYLSNAQRAIAEYFKGRIDSGAQMVDCVDASADLSLLLALAAATLPVQIGDGVWFVLDWGDGQYTVSEEPVVALGVDGFYVPASMPPRQHPSDVTYVPYERIGDDVFLTEGTAKNNREAKEAAYDLADC